MPLAGLPSEDLCRAQTAAVPDQIDRGDSASVIEQPSVPHGLSGAQ